MAAVSGFSGVCRSGWGYQLFRKGDFGDDIAQQGYSLYSIHHNLHVRGYKEEGTTTTPFDMAVRNDIDRFHLVKDVVDRVSSLGPCAAYLTQFIRDKLIDHQRYIRQHGEDMPEIRDWKWGTSDIHRASSHHRQRK